MAELDAILRAEGHIVEDPALSDQLREKRMRARWATAAKSRYQRLTSEERRIHNAKRRIRQLLPKSDNGESIKDEEAVRERIKDKNARKAEAARLRYHRMSASEKKLYNQRRTEAFRKRRIEESELLAMPIGRINGEALDRAQQIVVRNAKRAELARQRYQKMNPEQRKAYNAKRYTPKRKREEQPGTSSQKSRPKEDDEYDALSTIERDVAKQTQRAQQAIRQRMGQSQYQPQTIVHTIPSNSATTIGAHLIQQQPQVQYY
jgi:hypothetical protein